MQPPSSPSLHNSSLLLPLPLSSLSSAASLLAHSSPPHSPPVFSTEPHQGTLLVSLGVTAAVSAQLAASIGLLLLKSSSIYEYKLPLYLRFRLIGGIFFQAIVPIGTDSFAYAVCPLSLLAPLSGITIAATIVFTAARFCGVREPVHASDFAVVALIIAGVTLVSIYGPHASINVDVHRLGHYMLNTNWIIFAGVCGGVVVCWLAVYLLVDCECLNAIRPHPVPLARPLFEVLCADVYPSPPRSPPPIPSLPSPP